MKSKRPPLSFLEGQKALSALPRSSLTRDIRFCLSSTSDPLIPLIRGECAARSIAVGLSTVAFGTLRQHVLSPVDAIPEVYLLCPWDLVPSADWRKGVQSAVKDVALVLAEAESFLKQIKNRKPLAIAYLNAPLAPISTLRANTELVEASLLSMAYQRGVFVIDRSAFSLTPYLESGVLGNGGGLRLISNFLSELVCVDTQPKKILVTDLDNTWWAGIAAEDGPDKVTAESNGIGFKHYIYQTFVRTMSESGLIVVAVSRNDAETVSLALRNSFMATSQDIFSAVMASYQPKSAQILEVSSRLNIGLSDFVFVDDNPIEIEEVRSISTDITCVRFPSNAEALPEFIEELHSHFSKTNVTREDVSRRAQYNKMLAQAKVQYGNPSDLVSYLKTLKMRLLISDRSFGDRTRAVQLINKTNQFNMNGRRWLDDEVGYTLAAGGRLFTGALHDTSGDHGEILAALIDSSNKISAFVVSCRVFQRNIEHAFLAWLFSHDGARYTMQVQVTPRNEPFWSFARSALGVAPADGEIALQIEDVVSGLAATATVVEVVPPNANTEKER